MVGAGGVIRNEVGNILLSYSGPVGFYLVNKAELLALNTSLREATCLNPQHLFIEKDPLRKDPLRVIQLATESSRPPWYLADTIEEVVELSHNLNVSLHHIKCNANAEANHLAKEGVLRPSLIISIAC